MVPDYVCGSAPTDVAQVIRLTLEFEILAEAESSGLSIKYDSNGWTV